MSEPVESFKRVYDAPLYENSVPPGWRESRWVAFRRWFRYHFYYRWKKRPEMPFKFYTRIADLAPTLTELRAEFVYEACRLAAIAAKAPIVPVPWSEREGAFREQFLETIERQCGPQRSSSPEELHGSWMQAYLSMGWVCGEKYDREAKVHPDLVPYSQLGQLERDKDDVFIAVCEIARLYIR